MALLFGESAHAIYELEGLGEVGELILAFQMMLINDTPIGNYFVERFEALSLKGRNSTAAGNASFIG